MAALEAELHFLSSKNQAPCHSFIQQSLYTVSSQKHGLSHGKGKVTDNRRQMRNDASTFTDLLSEKKSIAGIRAAKWIKYRMQQSMKA